MLLLINCDILLLYNMYVWEFAVRVGIHQESILSPLIFAVVMDVVTEVVTKEGCALMYADDLVLICKTKEEVRQRFVA